MTLLRLSLVAGLCAAAAIPSAPPGQSIRKRNDGQCTGGPWVDPVYAGGYQDGVTQEMCETGWPSYGHPIGQINAYCGSQAVRGLNFNYDDPNQAQSIPGGTQVYGASSGNGITAQTLNINYAGGELINGVTMYAPDGAKYVRGLTITTNKGQTLQCGVDASSGFNAITQDVGTGYLIGVSGGYEDTIIDDLGFLFLNSPVASITVQDVSLTGGPTGTQDIVPTSLAQQHFYNGDSTNETWTFSGNKMVSSATTVTQSVVNTFSAGTTITFSAKLDLPFVGGTMASDASTFMWSSATTDTNTLVITTSQQLSWMQSGTLQPNEGITCDSVSGDGTGTFPYSATVTITLQDGVVYAQYKDYGSLYVQSVSSNSVSCKADTGS